MRMNKKMKYIRVAAILLLLAAVGVFSPHIAELSITGITDLAKESPFLSVMVLVGLYCLKTVLWIIPLAVLYISAGMLFPPVWAIIITCFCLFVEVTLGFFIGKYLGGDSIKEIMGKNRYSKWVVERSKENDVIGYFLIRLIPGPPADLTNMFLGAMKVPYSRFVLGTILGFIPGMLPFVLAGNAAANPLSAEFLVPFAASAVFTLCTLLIYQKRRQSREQKEIHIEE